MKIHPTPQNLPSYKQQLQVKENESWASRLHFEASFRHVEPFLLSKLSFATEKRATNGHTMLQGFCLRRQCNKLHGLQLIAQKKAKQRGVGDTPISPLFCCLKCSLLEDATKCAFLYHTGFAQSTITAFTSHLITLNSCGQSIW